jgi:glycine dehydrogenase
MPVALEHPDRFAQRHLGPRADDVAAMLSVVGAPSLAALIDETVPEDIRLRRALELPPPTSEAEVLARARALGARNRVARSFLGEGYYGCVTPPVILRNILENPGWYTQYTPYQAEIAQGRLEALLNFQTMVSDLCGLEVANASLLDEATAAAEAMHMAFAIAGADDRNFFFVADDVHPVTLEVVRTRAWANGVEVRVGDATRFDFEGAGTFGALFQHPGTEGRVADLRAPISRAKAAGAATAVATDLLALMTLVPPGEMGADMAFGSAQRMGVPLGYGGPHAAFFACRAEHVRRMPGRIIGVSKDAHGDRALRMALQTREQHIRREKATSNICTAQALLAIVAGMYAVYHGPEGLRAIAKRVHGAASALALALRRLGFRVVHETFFDTVCVEAPPAELDAIAASAERAGMLVRRVSPSRIAMSCDETTSAADLEQLIGVFAATKRAAAPAIAELARETESSLPVALCRTSAVLTHPVFHRYRSETEMLRYMRLLEGRDLSLAHSMIPLGSCTMKLNATAEMIPVTHADWNALHPFAPASHAEGYAEVFRELEQMICEVTGFAAVSLMPNSGAQGEYAGLLVVRRFHEARGESARDVCLIPSSAHGTNPASAVMAGYRVVVVRCTDTGDVDIADLEAKAREHAAKLAALMVTYPSTHGVFEAQIRRACEIVHAHGGLVYMDGANLNAQVGLCRPADIGADVCHLNLHKTFCIPHGGGGPGMGPIAVSARLARHLPRHPRANVGGEEGIGPVAQAPWGSASILLISWAYGRLMGGEGLRRATEYAILNANYVAARLSPYFPIVYQGNAGRVAHECILDLRAFKKSAGVEVEDVAKRLMDYGFHAPTMSWPIAGTMMVEPTESESKAELDRFCDAMISIHAEIRAIEEGRASRDDNPLKHAPHTAGRVTASEWPHAYSREEAAFPAPWLRARKFWPHVGRVDNAAGDRKLVCTCPPIEDYA